MKREEVQNILNHVDSVCLTIDSWTSAANENCISVTWHFINENCKFMSFLLECFSFSVSHTAENLAIKIKCVANEW